MSKQETRWHWRVVTSDGRPPQLPTRLLWVSPASTDRETSYLLVDVAVEIGSRVVHPLCERGPVASGSGEELLESFLLHRTRLAGGFFSAFENDRRRNAADVETGR